MSKCSLLICTFNRPVYLKQCLDSLLRADLSPLEAIYIIDDHSSDKEAIRLIQEFDIDGVEVIKIWKGKNKGIKDSLAIGYLLAFEHSDIVINLDGDGIIRKDFVAVLLGLKEKFPHNIVSGFNTTVKNRNPIIEEHPTYFKKKYASGINMVINRDEYENYLLPALSMPIGNHDFEASKLHMADGKAVIVAKPSVCQHIGTEISSMGHISLSEPPDVAEDFLPDIDPDERTLFEKAFFVKLLENVTLIAVDDNLDGIQKAADLSCQQIAFGSVKLLSHQKSTDHRVINIRKLGSKREYSKFMMKELAPYIDTKYFITIQSDGYIVNGEVWDDRWYGYDYIGSPWQWYTDGHNVGNGGMSFRSKHLHQILHDDPNIIPTNDNIISDMQEDHNICRIYRNYLERKYNILFAPVEVAERFAIEAWNVPPPNNRYSGQFGFHGGRVDFSHAQLSHIPYIKK